MGVVEPETSVLQDSVKQDEQQACKDDNDVRTIQPETSLLEDNVKAVEPEISLENDTSYVIT